MGICLKWNCHKFDTCMSGGGQQRAICEADEGYLDKECLGRIAINGYSGLLTHAHGVGALQPVATPPPVTPLATQSAQLTLKGGVSTCAIPKVRFSRGRGKSMSRQIACCIQSPHAAPKYPNEICHRRKSCGSFLGAHAPTFGDPPAQCSHTARPRRTRARPACCSRADPRAGTSR
jgi:hypothetical protein